MTRLHCFHGRHTPLLFYLFFFHLGGVYHLAVVHRASEHIRMQRSPQHTDLISLGHIISFGFPLHGWIIRQSILFCRGTSMLHNGCANLFPIRAVQSLLFHTRLVTVIQNVMRTSLTVVFICISLVVRESELLFMYLLAICTCFLKCLFKVFFFLPNFNKIVVILLFD